MAKTRQYAPDALIPVRSPVAVKVPDDANRITGQKAQAFWVDILGATGYRGQDLHRRGAIRRQIASHRVDGACRRDSG